MLKSPLASRIAMAGILALGAGSFHRLTDPPSARASFYSYRCSQSAIKELCSYGCGIYGGYNGSCTSNAAEGTFRCGCYLGEHVTCDLAGVCVPS